MYRVIYDYTSDSADQINLTIGDRFNKCKDVGNGWFLGTNQNTGETGYFPGQYVEEITDLDADVAKPTAEVLFREKLSNNDKVITGVNTQNGAKKEQAKVNIDNKTSKDAEKQSEGDGGNNHKTKNGKLKKRPIKGNPLSNFIRKTKHNIFSTQFHEYRVLKSVLSVIAALLASGVLFVLLVYSYNIPMVVSGGLTGVVFVVMALSFALTTRGRVVGLLLLPSMSTGRGRAAMFSIIAALLLSGPVMNITNNCEEVAASLACGTELAYNKTQELREAAEAPLRAIVDQIEETTQRLKQLASGIIGPLKKIEDSIAKVTEQAKKAADAFSNVDKECNRAFSRAYDSCTKETNKVKDSCDDVFDKLPGGGGFLSGRRKRSANTVLSRSKRGVCDIFKGSKICKPLKGQLCKPFDAVDTGISEVINGIRTAIDEFKDQLTFDVIQRKNIEGTANVSQTAEQIRQNIENEIREQTEVFHTILTWITRIFSVVLIFLVMQSLLYVRSFLTKDKFDNFYITNRLKRADKERKAEGMKTILPLKKKEKRLYIDSTKIKLSPAEKNSFKVGIVTWMLNFVIGVITVLFDILLYWIMKIVTKHAQVEVTITGEADITLDVQGKGTLAAIVRSFVVGVSQQSQYNASVNFTECLPTPAPPDYSNFAVILTVYIIAVILIITQAYFLRLRRKCVAYFYPDRELERLDYLTKRIFRKRKGLLDKLKRFAKKSVRQKKLVEREDKNVISKLFKLGKKQDKSKICLSCEEDCSKNSVTCKNNSHVFCTECFSMLKNTCPVCPDNKTQN